MKPFVWDAHFTTGLDLVDEQHRKLLDLINALGTAHNNPDRPEVLQEVFDRLAQYALRHFADEEQQMATAGLDPRTRVAHEQQHAEFIEQVTLMWGQRKFMRHPEEILHGYLSGWLGFHILGDDQQMAHQLRDVAEGVPAHVAYERVSRPLDGSKNAMVNALRSMSHALSGQSRELATANTELEERVDERTRELAEANEKLLLLSRTDGLLGIANRGAFDRQLDLEWGRTRRTGAPLGLLMLDVDHFKRFNDTYGHQMGDSGLQSVAAAAGGAIRRPADFLARYGGEEMVVVLPGTTLEGARLVAENIVAQVAALRIPHSASTTAPWLTVSIGAASLVPSREETPGSRPAALVAAADAALYAAKASGRNRVCTEGRTPG